MNAPDIYKKAKHAQVRELYRDETLWVLDKPAGVLSHPNPPQDRSSKAIVRTQFDYDRELFRLDVPGGKQRQVHLVHRLDQETSGIILCAFSGEAAAKLREAFFHGEVQKEYRAVVVGEPRADKGVWQDRLEKRSEKGRVSVRAVDGHPNATTEFRVLERFPCGLTLLSLRPETGRTHQLRVQTSSRGLPICGDERYGDFEANRFVRDEIALRHMFLHAFRVRCRHPSSGHLLRLEAPLTSRLADPLAAMAKLQKKVPRQRGKPGRK